MNKIKSIISSTTNINVKRFQSKINDNTVKEAINLFNKVKTTFFNNVKTIFTMKRVGRLFDSVNSSIIAYCSLCF